MADFTAEVTEWCNRARARADEVFRAIAADAVAAVQEKTPVDTGFLRSNWTAIKDGDQEPVEGRIPPASAAIAEAHVGQVLVILNPTVYARRIEYGFVGEDSAGRSYSQGGAHMVQQTIAEMPEIARRATERILAGGR